jgi:hypothetical protein
MTFICFHFLFYILQIISIFIAAIHKTKTNKNSIKIIIWLVVGGSSDNVYIRVSLSL